MLLCDYAEEHGGKLYIMGGGWSRLAANRPTNMALAIKLAIPWNQANTPHELRVRLVTEDGEQVPDDEGKPIELSGKLEVGRPPGLRPGTNLDAPLALTVGPLSLVPCGYRWEFHVDGMPLAQTTFEAIGG